MKCKDCFHYEVCLLGACVSGKTGICLNFKNRNTIIELPCKIGGVVYVITDKIPCCACTSCSDFCHKNCPFDDRKNLVIKKAIVCGVENDGITSWARLAIESDEMCHSYDCVRFFGEFGKSVFLNKNEAQNKLKEIGCEQN